MPDNRVQLIVTLQPEVRQQVCPVLLDANAVDDFLEWLRINSEFETRLREEHAYRITVLTNHLKQRHDWKRPDKTGLKDKLERLNIALVSYSAAHDEVLIDEVQRAYFGNDATARKSAELLAFGRRRSSDG